MKKKINIIFFAFALFLLPVYSQDLDDDYDEKHVEEMEETPNFNFVKASFLLGFHIPDEEFHNGNNFSFNINNSINEYAFFSLGINYDKFHGINDNKREYELNEVSIGIGFFFNFLRFYHNNSYVGIELGSYHIKNTETLKLDVKNAGNHLMIAWILGHYYSINDRIDLEGTIHIKANHLRNFSANIGIGYRIFP